MAKKVATQNQGTEKTEKNVAKKTMSKAEKSKPEVVADSLVAEKDINNKGKQSCKMSRETMINVLIGAVGLVVAGVMFIIGCLVGAKNGKIGPSGNNGLSGKNGATWYSGTEVPTENSGFGVVGDFYFDEDDQNIYKLTEDGWTFVSNIRGQQGFFSEYYCGYDGYIWNGRERTEYKVSAQTEEGVIENTIGAKDTMSNYFNGAYLNLYSNTIALMAGYDSIKNTTNFSNKRIVEICVYAEEDGKLFIGEAKLSDVISARTNGAIFSARTGTSYNVKKGLNRIKVLLNVGANATIVIGGRESVGIFMFAEIPVNDEAGNYTYIDGNAYNDQIISTQGNYADTVLVKVTQQVAEP